MKEKIITAACESFKLKTRIASVSEHNKNAQAIAKHWLKEFGFELERDF